MRMKIMVSIDVTQLLLILSSFFFLTTLLLLLLVMPFFRLLINRWKLKLLAKKGFLPVYIRYKNRIIKEFIVNTKDPTFEIDNYRFNIREESIHDFNGFRCLFYESDCPEPLAMITNEDKEIIVNLNGTLSKMKGKVVDANLYDLTCKQFYYAGIAFANRNKNMIMLLLIITLIVVIVFGAFNYFSISKMTSICQNTIFNATNVINSLTIKPIAG